MVREVELTGGRVALVDGVCYDGDVVSGSSCSRVSVSHRASRYVRICSAISSRRCFWISWLRFSSVFCFSLWIWVSISLRYPSGSSILCSVFSVWDRTWYFSMAYFISILCVRLHAARSRVLRKTAVNSASVSSFVSPFSSLGCAPPVLCGYGGGWQA